MVRRARTKARLREFAGGRHSGSRRNGARQLAGARSVWCWIARRYLQDTWAAWVDRVAAAAAARSSAFLALRKRDGVKVFFVTNRSVPNKEDTLKNLAALGITASDDTVLCPGENGWSIR